MLAGSVAGSSKTFIHQRMCKLKDSAIESNHCKNMRFSGPEKIMRKRTKNKTAEKPKKPRSQHPGTQWDENTMRDLIQHMSELQSNLAALHSIAERGTRRSM